MRPPHHSGLTVPELLVILCIIATFIFFALPDTGGGGLKQMQATQALSNMKQLYLSTQAMTQDGLTNGDTGLAWPGDSGGTFTNWMTQLVPSYLTTNDFRKLVSVAGRITPQGTLPMANTNGVLVYAVSTNSPARTVFLSTANYLNDPKGGAFNPKISLFANRSFAVFWKNGSGAVLTNKLAGKTEAVGSFAPLCQ